MVKWPSVNVVVVVWYIVLPQLGVYYSTKPHLILCWEQCFFLKCFSLRILEGGLSCNCMLQIATQVPAITCLLIFWLAIQEKNRYNIWLFPPLGMLYVAIAGCIACDYFNFLESLNLGYNEKSL
jgi:hypothetical protein